MKSREPECMAAYARRYRADNLETLKAYINAYHRERYDSDPEWVARRKAQRRRYYEEHREELLAKRREKTVKRWREDPVWAEKERARKRERRVADPAVAQRNRDVTKAWDLANPEQARQRHANAQAARRARLAKVAEPIDRMAIYERDEGICHLCGDPVERERFHLEHRVPLSRGGSHTEANVAIAHPRCNLVKGARLIEEVTT